MGRAIIRRISMPVTGTTPTIITHARLPSAPPSDSNKTENNKFMKRTHFYIGIVSIVAVIAGSSCAKLTPKIYTQVPNANYWQTADQIAAGVAPAYTALTQIPDGAIWEL